MFVFRGGKYKVKNLETKQICCKNQPCLSNLCAFLKKVDLMFVELITYSQVITALFPFCSRIISGSLLVILCSSFGWEQRKMGGEMGVKPG